MNVDLIVGVHSIAWALKMRNHQGAELVICRDVLDSQLAEFKKSPELLITIVSPENFQAEAQKLFSYLGFEYQRVPGNAVLKINSLEIYELDWLYKELERKDNFKMLILDSVTDVHNRAAIMRTAAFYKIDAMLFSQKNFDGFPPSFYRIASGGTELVSVVNCSSLPRAIEQLKERGLAVIGFDERGETLNRESCSDKKLALVLGAEDTGLSNAVQRTLTKVVALDGPGELKTLNVSVSAAVAMQKIWG
ncbi:MAG: hypothetical protein COW00_05260 [Bdellovibrio sp. CG12_big_fil_rev_8_21_14_0_65_39_13]|nr:MAG: hypothetical protein COW78_17795 [Bdellovibrio sp. CG22_combo_CG10-13_8_21_14_all_39_27]PIQ60641.1 MAG: hypothetical protein COW00_05260 [Bdellovibrio sp. CG12_big_fil_rev_8_21_14_0_65_39_13]PIR37025.1 MAG: hypothetical protein COV37_00620 [Bdellovibrio sp. CG11_big_fil_rev_8_21_14_0_20_39_38]